jgi:hypothetical protein
MEGFTTEARFTSKLLNDVRRGRTRAVVAKIWQGMYSNAGVPDFFVCEDNKTTWCEVKLLSTPRRLFVPLQLETCKRMNAWYLIWDARRRTGWLFKAREYEGWRATPRHTYAELVELIKRQF